MDNDTQLESPGPRKAKTLPKRLWFLATVLAILALSGTGYFFLSRSPNQVPQDIRGLSTNFPLYYPADLPKGLTYDPSLFRPSSSVIIYGFRRGKKPPLLITVQPKPKTVKFEDFYNRLLTDKADITSPEGKAVLGTAGGKTFGSLLTDQTWVLVTSPPDLDRATLGQLVSSLTRIKH